MGDWSIVASPNSGTATNLYAANENSNSIERFAPDGTPSVFANTNMNNPTFVAIAGPVPEITSITRTTSGGMRLEGIGVPNQLNRIEASADLTNSSWPTLTSISVGASGVFSYEDVDAVNFSRRFYRLTYP